MKESSDNFIVVHYDWIAVGVGAVALLASLVVLVLALGSSPEKGADSYTRRLNALRPSGEGVSSDDMQFFLSASRLAKAPPSLSEIDPKRASFMASERRVVCMGDNADSNKTACGRPIPADASVCPFCKTPQPAVVKVLIDTDNDGIPNDYEVANGLNPNDSSDADKDADGDGFTNLEEFKAGTDPNDASSHPDYADSLSVDGSLKQTFLPVFFQNVNPVRGGYRYSFRDPNAIVPGRSIRGVTHSVLAGEVIGDTGFVVSNYTAKTELRAVKGAVGMKRNVDVSTVDIVRKSDGKTLTLTIGERNVPVDIQTHIIYNRGAKSQDWNVATGSILDLNGQQYRIAAIKKVVRGFEVVVEEVSTGKQKVLQGLD